MPAPFPTVWITGASSGIGRALALRLAREGSTVFASARSAEGLVELEAEAATRGVPGRILPLPVDVTDRDAVAAAVEAARADAPIDLAVLNAGTYLPVDIKRFDAGRFETQVAVNLVGTANCLQALLPDMIARRTGRVALVASVAGYRGLPTGAAYGASKAALINLAESLRLELHGSGVSVQLVNPGFVRTPLTDRNDFRMPFLMPVDKAAERMARGFRTDRFEITFPKRFTWQLKLLRLLPYALYFPLVRWATRR